MSVCLHLFQQLKNFKSLIFQTLTESLIVHFVVVLYESIVMLTSLLIVECSLITFSDFFESLFSGCCHPCCKVWQVGNLRKLFRNSKKENIHSLNLSLSFFLSFSFPLVSYISFFTCPPHYLNKKKLLFFILL